MSLVSLLWSSGGLMLLLAFNFWVFDAGYKYGVKVTETRWKDALRGKP